MKRYKNFINEKKHYILNKKSRIKDYLEDDSSPYSPVEIVVWMKKYNFDDMAFAQLVSDDKVNINDVFGLRISSKNPKNKYYFDDTSHNKDGIEIPESKIEIDGIVFHLFVDRKGSNDENRARQKPGFDYEREIIDINKLSTDEIYTAKWDGFGSIKEEMFIDRINSGKTIYFVDGQNEKEINWEDLSDKYKKDYKWNIKHIKKGNAVDMASYKRIAGLDDDFNYSGETGMFTLCVGIYDNDDLEEYIIFINFDVWITYLHDIERVKEMHIDIGNYKIGKNEKRPEDDSEWQTKFLDKYKDLRNNGSIRLRAKRNPGQLRIQSSIPITIFRNIILKENKHIKIS